MTATTAADGLRRRESRIGRLALTFAAAHVASRALWLRGARVGPGPAVPEFAGAVAFAAWVVARSSPAPLRSALDSEGSPQA